MLHTAKPLSPTSLATLQAIADGVRHGFEIMGTTGLASGTVYPILARLEEAGLVRSRWEAPMIARRAKRPPRRYYQISAAGTRALAHAVEHYRGVGGRRTARAATPR
jgi:PadR family transcriptional regulator PadR